MEHKVNDLYVTSTPVPHKYMSSAVALCFTNKQTPPSFKQCQKSLILLYGVLAALALPTYPISPLAGRPCEWANTVAKDAASLYWLGIPAIQIKFHVVCFSIAVAHTRAKVTSYLREFC